MRASQSPLCLSCLIVFAVSLLLGACVSGREPTDTYTSRGGAVTAIETSRESCIRSCNEEYERCNDMLSSTRSDVSNQAMPKPFGVGQECKDALRSCLPRCKGR